LFVGAILLLLLLAMGINGLQLLPGQPFNLGQPAPANIATELLGGNDNILGVPLIRAVLLVSAILFPIAIVSMLLTAKGRRQLFAALMATISLALIFLTLRRLVRPDGNQSFAPAAQAADAAPPAASQMPIDVFNPTSSEWLVIGVSLVIALLLCVAIIAIVRLAWRRRHPSDTALLEVAEQAQQALDALQAGGEIRDVILRCYAEMSRVLQKERGIQRRAAMTAREFEQALHERGIPDEPVQRLTRLFEQVRYGHEHPGADGEQAAAASLNAIVAACETSAGARGQLT
jgi:Domain of unknown function (DUF4129)/Domain of unknown function (DUF4381)